MTARWPRCGRRCSDCTVLYCTVLYCTVLYCTVLQVLRLNTRGQLGLGERCVVPLQQPDSVELEVAVCEGVAGGWSYDEGSRAMVFTVQYQVVLQKVPSEGS